MDGIFSLCYLKNTLPAFIRSGDHFTLKDDDSNEQPLPSVDLLEMQWDLQRLIGMSGAADWVLAEDDSESDIGELGENCLVDKDLQDSKRLCYEDEDGR